MNQSRIFLTGILTVLIAVPALAAVGDITFQPNDNVENSCNIGVLGVSENTANTNAIWIINKYTCPAGSYLPAGEGWTSDDQYTDNNCAPCAANTYCVGSATSSDATNGKFEYSPNSAKGTRTCPSGYPSSDANSDSESDCYRTCTTGDVAHSNAVTGRFYSGETQQSNSCEPTSTNGCVVGYHYVAATPDLNVTIGTVSGSGSTSGTTFTVTYGNNKGTITGKSKCSTQEGTTNNRTWTNPTILSTVSDNFGQYCYCQLDSYTPYGGTAQSLSGSWVLANDYGSEAPLCSSDCVYDCLALQRVDSNYLAFRSAMFGAVQPGLAQCAANTININWNGADGNLFEAGTCTYDGPLVTPSTAPDKRGYTFTGWRFITQ